MILNDINIYIYIQGYSKNTLFMQHVSNRIVQIARDVRFTNILSRFGKTQKRKDRLNNARGGKVEST